MLYPYIETPPCIRLFQFSPTTQPVPTPKRHHDRLHTQNCLGSRAHAFPASAAISVVLGGTRPAERVLRERSRQSLLAGDLLATDKAVNSHCNSSIDINRAAVFAQTHFGEGLADSQDGFKMTDLQRC